MKLFIYFFNVLILSLITGTEYASFKDKSIILSSLAVAVLCVINLVIGIIAQLDKKPIFKHCYFLAFGIPFAFLVLLSV
jgi:hypothetical protein